MQQIFQDFLKSFNKESNTDSIHNLIKQLKQQQPNKYRSQEQIIQQLQNFIPIQQKEKFQQLITIYQKLQCNNKYGINLLISLLELRKNTELKSEICFADINFDQIEQEIEEKQIIPKQDNLQYTPQPEFVQELKVLAQGKNTKHFRYEINTEGLLLPQLKQEYQGKFRWNDISIIKTLNSYFSQLLLLADLIKTQSKSHDLYKQTFYNSINKAYNELLNIIENYQITLSPIVIVSNILYNIYPNIQILLRYAQDVQQFNISGIDILMYLLNQEEIFGQNNYEQNLIKILYNLLLQQIQQFIATNTHPLSFPIVDNKQINEQGNRYQLINLQYKNKIINQICEKILKIKNQLNYMQTICKVTIDFNQFQGFQQFIQLTTCDDINQENVLQQFSTQIVLIDNLTQFQVFTSNQLKQRLLETFKLIDVFKLIGEVFLFKNIQFNQQFNQIRNKQFGAIQAQNEVEFLLETTLKNIHKKVFSNIEVKKQNNVLELNLHPVELTIIFNNQFINCLTQYQNMYHNLMNIQKQIQIAKQMYRRSFTVSNVLQQNLLSNTNKLIMNLQQAITMDIITQFDTMTQKFDKSDLIIEDSIQTVNNLTEILMQIERKYEKLINQIYGVVTDFVQSLTDKTKYIDINIVTQDYQIFMQQQLSQYRKDFISYGLFL